MAHSQIVERGAILPGLPQRRNLRLAAMMAAIPGLAQLETDPELLDAHEVLSETRRTVDLISALFGLLVLGLVAVAGWGFS